MEYQVPGAVDRVWASPGPPIQVKSWILMIRPDPANLTPPMCGSDQGNPKRRTWDPGGTCHWKTDRSWTTDTRTWTMDGVSSSEPERRTWDSGGTCHWKIWRSDKELHLVVNSNGFDLVTGVNNPLWGGRSPRNVPQISPDYIKASKNKQAAGILYLFQPSSEEGTLLHLMGRYQQPEENSISYIYFIKFT